MTAAKQELETSALLDAFDTHLQAAGWGSFIFKDGFEVGSDINTPTIALHFLPNGPEPFQMGDTVQKYYQRVLQLDLYMETRGRAYALVDDLMDFIDLMAVPVVDPLNGNAVVGSITCQNTDSIYGELFTLNYDQPKLLKARGIVRATIESHYPQG